MPYRWTPAPPPSIFGVTDTPSNCYPNLSADWPLIVSLIQWLPSAWVECVSSLPQNWWMTGVEINWPPSALPSEIEIGVGASGMEVPVLRLAYPGTPVFPLTPMLNYQFLPILITAGSRIVARVFSAAISGAATITGFNGHPANSVIRHPIPGPLTAQVVTPEIGTFRTLNTGASWGYGAWSEIFSNTRFAIPMALNSFTFNVDLSTTMQVQFGLGPIGSEQVCAELRVNPISSLARIFTFFLPILIPANTRLSMRATSESSAFIVGGIKTFLNTLN